MNNLSDKFIQHEVFDFYLYDHQNRLVSKIDTIRENEITCTRTGRWLLKLKDAVIDKRFFQYIIDNNQFEGSIYGKSLVYNAEEEKKYKYEMEMPKVKMLYYKIKKDLDSVSEVDALFEILKPININIE